MASALQIETLLRAALGVCVSELGLDEARAAVRAASSVAPQPELEAMRPPRKPLARWSELLDETSSDEERDQRSEPTRSNALQKSCDVTNKDGRFAG